jgi:nascent polypeptide-associated complex subunit alpha
MISMDPAQMQRTLKQLGIKTRNIDAQEVLIKTSAGTVSIRKPQVVEMEMQGNKMYQITGQTVEIPYTEEDIRMVMEQTNVDKDRAIELLGRAEGDIAKAIMLNEE